MMERSISFGAQGSRQKLSQVQLPEAANIVVVVLVKIAEALAMRVDIGEHVHHIVLGLKPEDGPRLLIGDLVVPEVLKVLDFDRRFCCRSVLQPLP